MFNRAIRRSSVNSGQNMKQTQPVLDYYPDDKIVHINAAQSQIRVLSEIIGLLVPLKESHDGHDDDQELPQGTPMNAAQLIPSSVTA